jgi:predicted site-specific integrase-resolvase
MPIKINSKTYYRTSEVCRLARISRSTLLRWLKAADLPVQDFRDRRSWRLFTEEDARVLAAEANRVCRVPRQ